MRLRGGGCLQVCGGGRCLRNVSDLKRQAQNHFLAICRRIIVREMGGRPAGSNALTEARYGCVWVVLLRNWQCVYVSVFPCW